MNSAEATMWVSVAFVVALTLLVGWIAWLVSRVERSRQRAQADVRLELLRRLDGAAELRALLEADNGLRSLVGDPLDALRDRTVRSVGHGIVALFVGTSLAIAGAVASVGAATAAGLLVVGGGLGLLVAAAVTRRLGLQWASKASVE